MNIQNYLNAMCPCYGRIPCNDQYFEGCPPSADAHVDHGRGQLKRIRLSAGRDVGSTSGTTVAAAS
jgi:hypothetical protein